MKFKRITAKDTKAIKEFFEKKGLYVEIDTDDSGIMQIVINDSKGDVIKFTKTPYDSIYCYKRELVKENFTIVKWKIGAEEFIRQFREDDSTESDLLREELCSKGISYDVTTEEVVVG
jgi:hypothetical protein